MGDVTSVEGQSEPSNVPSFEKVKYFDKSKFCLLPPCLLELSGELRDWPTLLQQQMFCLLAVFFAVELSLK